MSCNCGCTNPTAVVPPIVKFVRESAEAGNGCALKQPFETLASLSFVPQAVAAMQSLKVCAASNYIIGTCVLLIDAAGNTQVQRVTGHSGTDTLILTAYANDYSDTTTTLTAPIYAQPLGICPPDTTSGEECFRLNARTDAAFVMPASVDDEGSAVAVTFTESVSLPLGAEVFIEGAGWMEVAEPPVGDFEECTATHYFLNLGTEGNETPGQTVAGDAYAIIGQAPVTTYNPTSGTISMVQTSHSVTVGSMGSGGTNSSNSSPFVLPWAAAVNIAPTITGDASSATANTQFTYKVEYSSDSGATWADATGTTLVLVRGGPGQTYVTVWKALAAGTYLFRFVVTTIGGSPTYPVIGALDVHVGAIRNTAIVS